MKPDPESIDATVEIGSRLGLMPPTDRLANLASRLRGSPESVAVIGLVKRGKSTLVNRLVGAEVSAVSATPETAAIISVRTGPRAAWGRTVSGALIELPTAPKQFAVKARRGNDHEITEAGIVGPFRLPEGVTLVDTPGVDDAAIDQDGYAAELQRQWIRSGAGAALVVVSVPPGISAPDRRLIEHASEVFAGEVTVLVKATSGDVSDDDLRDTVDFVARQVDCPVLVTPDADPRGGWSTDAAFVSVEEAVVTMAGRAARRLASDVRHYEAHVDELIGAIESASAVHLDSLHDVLADPPAAAAPSLINAVANRRDQLNEERRRRDAAAEERRRAKEVEGLDRSADRLVAIVKERARMGDLNASSAVAELVPLARSGSPVAIAEIERLLSSRAWSRSGLALPILVGALPEPRAAGVAASMDATDGEREHLLTTDLPDSVREALEAKLVGSAVLRTDLDALHRLRKLLRDPTNKAAVFRREADVVVQRFVSLAKYADQHNRGTLLSAKNDLSKWLKRPHQDVPDAAAIIIDVERRANEALDAFAIRKSRHTREALIASYQHVGNDPSAWAKRVQGVEEQAQWVLDLAPPSEDTRALEAALAQSRTARPGWTAAYTTALEQAKRRPVSLQENWTLAYYASFAGWLVACLVLPASLAAGFLIWLASFALWGFSRNQRELQDWKDHYRRPALPDPFTGGSSLSPDSSPGAQPPPSDALHPAHDVPATVASGVEHPPPKTAGLLPRGALVVVAILALAIVGVSVQGVQNAMRDDPADESARVIAFLETNGTTGPFARCVADQLTDDLDRDDLDQLLNYNSTTDNIAALEAASELCETRLRPTPTIAQATTPTTTQATTTTMTRATTTTTTRATTTTTTPVWQLARADPGFRYLAEDGYDPNYELTSRLEEWRRIQNGIVNSIIDGYYEQARYVCEDLFPTFTDDEIRPHPPIGLPDVAADTAALIRQADDIVAACAEFPMESEQVRDAILTFEGSYSSYNSKYKMP